MSINIQTQLWQKAFQHFELGQYKASSIVCRKLLKKDPRNADILHLAALSNMRQGKAKQAIEMQRKAVKSRPLDASLHFNLANMFFETGAPTKALPHFEKAASIKPDTSELLWALMNCLTAIDKNRSQARHHSPELEEAAKIARQLFATDPDLVRAGGALVKILTTLGRLDEAEFVLRDVLQRLPQHLQSQLSLVSILKDKGEFEEAQSLCRDILEHTPGQPQAYMSISNIKATAINDEDVSHIRKLLKLGELPARDKAHLNFTLGRYFDAMEKADQAFSHFAAANAASMETASKDVDVEISTIERIRKAFHADLFSDAHGGCASELPVFIVGMPRSGTSLLEHILASHPSVAGCGELGDLSILASELHSCGFFPEGIHKLKDSRRTELGQRFADIMVSYAGDAQRAVDKMPQNFMLIGLIYLLLPKSKIIHCRRDPVATCFSNYVTPFEDNRMANDLEAIGKFYSAYDGLMAHWRMVLPEGSILDVDYEDLIDQPEENIRRIVDYCGLPWDEGCLTFHRTPRDVRTASAAQVRQPLMKNRSQRWRLYEKHLTSLIKQLSPHRKGL